MFNTIPRQQTLKKRENRIDIGSIKLKVIKERQESQPQHVQQFFNTQLFDQILEKCALFFVVLFQKNILIKNLEKAKQQHLEGFNHVDISAHIQELQREENTHRLSISPLYSQLIMKFSQYQHPHRDRQFFEHFYDTLITILDVIFQGFKKREEIETQLGYLFRTKHFNCYQVKNAPLRSVDTLTVKELYAVRHETKNRALNAKLISALCVKPKPLAVQAASVTNSPLIRQFIASPIVARCYMKDPQLRQELFTPKKKKTGKIKQSFRNNPEGGAGHSIDIEVSNTIQKDTVSRQQEGPNTISRSSPQVQLQCQGQQPNMANTAKLLQAAFNYNVDPGDTTQEDLKNLEDLKRSLVLPPQRHDSLGSSQRVNGDDSILLSNRKSTIDASASKTKTTMT